MKNLTKDIAIKSSRIMIQESKIIVCIKKRSKSYGVIESCMAYPKTEANLMVAKRYE